MLEACLFKWSSKRLYFPVPGFKSMFFVFRRGVLPTGPQKKLHMAVLKK